MSDVEAELLELEERSWTANREGDAEFYRDYMTDEALGVSQYGVIDKSAALEGFAANRNPYLSTTSDDRRVLLISDDAAVVTGRTRIEALPEGATDTVTFTVRTSTVFVRRDGSWKAAFFQQTPIPG
jgi:uncharacterized protein (TIGR02246 family)